MIAWPMELIDSTVTSTRAILATYALTAATRPPSPARRSAGSASCPPGTALPPGGPLPADPADGPGHATTTPTGRGVGEVSVRAAPPLAGAGVVNLRPEPLPLIAHGEPQGRPAGHGCGQAPRAPGQPGQAPGQAGDVTLRDSRSSPITSTTHTTPLECANPRAGAMASEPVTPGIRHHVRIVAYAHGGQPLGLPVTGPGPVPCQNSPISVDQQLHPC